MKRSGGWFGPVSAMLKGGLLVALMMLCASAFGSKQKSVAVSKLRPLPTGVTLPVRLGRTLRAGSVPVGTKIVVKTTQRVPVSQTAYLDWGAVLTGEITASDAGDG